MHNFLSKIGIKHRRFLQNISLSHTCTYNRLCKYGMLFCQMSQKHEKIMQYEIIIDIHHVYTCIFHVRLHL